MIDIVSVITGLPATVEGVVKTCRAIQRWQGLQAEHALVINRAVFGTKKLVYFASFVNTEELSDSKKSRNVWSDPDDPTLQESDVRRLLLEEALLHANDALVRVEGAVTDWTTRLKLGDVDVDGRAFMEKVVASLAKLKPRRVRKKTVLMKPSSAASKLHAEIAYLATGCRQIGDAMDAMEHWTTQFKDILLTSPTIRLIRNPSIPEFGSISDVADELLFVAQANDREKAQSPVTMISSDFLQDMVDLDPKHPTGIYTLESGPYATCIVDCRNIDHLIRYDKEDQAINDTNRIARIFAEDNTNAVTSSDFDLEVGVLRCCGWAEITGDTFLKMHNLVFRLPPGSRKPQTLRMLLLAGPPKHPLNDRIDFCIRLATSVLILHSVNLVHKDIRPDSILVVERFGAGRNCCPRKLGSPYLGNFNHMRSEVSDTVKNPFQYSALMRILYTHPLHTTSNEHTRYRMRDDIYSLGICLLEIALWRSFFAWNEHRECYDTDETAFDFSSEKYEKIFEEEGQPWHRNAAWLVRLDLIELAEREVPIILGDSFAQIIVACLCFGDVKKPTRPEAARQIEGEDRTPKSESVAFVKDVLSKLRLLRLA